MSIKPGEGHIVPGDTNGVQDVFVHDRLRAETERVSVTSAGAEGNGYSGQVSISVDGRFVVFHSGADNLATSDSNSAFDIFVHDRSLATTERVSISSSGAECNGFCFDPSISDDGRYVAFMSFASNLVPGDSNGKYDIFVHDRLTKTTDRVSISSSGEQGTGNSNAPSISGNGRFVAFSSSSRNLVPQDPWYHWNALVHDRLTGVTERVSANSFGTRGKGHSDRPSISPDGRLVAFDSFAQNLIRGDTNSTEDVFIRDRWDGRGRNSIYLAGPSFVQARNPIELTWQSTRGGSDYWLLLSQNTGGAWASGHRFDIGYPARLIARGTNAANGLGSFTLQSAPPYAVGHTLYFELGARDGEGVVYDSNVHGVAIQ